MALYQVTQGSTINATDVNQFDQLLTGVMTDQQVTIANRISAQMSGATAQSGYVGGTSGAVPASGTFQVGDLVIDGAVGVTRICTVSGTPGTWVSQASVKLQEIVLSTASSSVTFSNIPGGYRDLEIRAFAKATGVTTSANLVIQFNGDTGTNYAWTVLFNQFNVQGPNVNGGISVSGMQGGKLSYTDYGGTMIIVYNYADASVTKRKPISAFSGAGDGTLWNNYYTGDWHPANPTAITSITLSSDAGSIDVNSRFSLIALL
jgi:hypothetical protein